MVKSKELDFHVAQGIAAYVDFLRHLRLEEFRQTISDILSDEIASLKELAVREGIAHGHLQVTQKEIDFLIQLNRGGEKGVHGFIAEFAEVGIRNARAAFDQLEETSKVLNNNGPADLIIGGKEIQMKFYANFLQALQTAPKYEQDLLFPKDQIEVIQKIMANEKIVHYRGERLTLAKIEAIKKIIQEEESRRGLTWNKWLYSSVNEYRDVQVKTIHETISTEKERMLRAGEKERQEIHAQKNRAQEAAKLKAQPNLGEAAKVAGIGAVVQAGMAFGLFVYQRHKAGKEIWEFKESDWKAAGIEVGMAAGKGGFTGFAIYGLTNVCQLSAPSAGAITAGTFGLLRATIAFRTGQIDEAGFMNQLTLNALDATGSAIGAAVGQVLIPVPVLGALVGSILASTCLNLGKGFLSDHERKLIQAYQNKIDQHVQLLAFEEKQMLQQLLDKFHALGKLQEYSFDRNINIQLRLQTSVDFGVALGIEDDRLLHNQKEIDDYFLS